MSNGYTLTSSEQSLTVSENIHLVPLVLLMTSAFIGKSHISSTLLEISKRVDPESVKAHSSARDDFWQDRAQAWRTRFMSHIKTKQGEREAGGMDVSYVL
jgi:hypothetical protein